MVLTHDRTRLTTPASITTLLMTTTDTTTTMTGGNCPIHNLPLVLIKNGNRIPKATLPPWLWNKRTQLIAAAECNQMGGRIKPDIMGVYAARHSDTDEPRNARLHEPDERRRRWI